MDGPGTAVRVTRERRRADEWAVVLAAAGIPHWMRERLDGWALLVPPDDAATALHALDAYDQESARAIEGRDVPARLERPPTIAGAVVALLLIGFFAITGPRARWSVWFAQGSADAARMLAGEWWRAITALTLHADAPHLLGNAVAAAVLLTAVCWYLGAGVGLGLTLLAGAGGNALTALAHHTDHVSVGASTAVFGAIGILAMLRIVAPDRIGSSGRKTWVVVAAALALLAFLGTGPEVDLLAHAFGLAAGAALGVIGALTLRRPVPPPVQWLLVITTAAIIAAAWRLAL
jgi:membrane associated rhomboid family serine protease